MPPAPVITDLDAARALFAGLADERVEIVEAAYLDPNWRYCGRSRFAGSFAWVGAPIRAIVIAALQANAARVILAHNHPSGDATPSADDIRVTQRLALVLSVLEMPLIDHLIVTSRAMSSMRERGLL